MRSPLLLLGLALAPLPAQVSVIVPAAYADRDAPAMGESPGFSNPFRQQVVLRDRLLTALAGKTITALTLRRDGQYPVALRGGRAKVTVALGVTTRDPTLTSPLFAENLPASTTVFQGEIALPAAPAPQGRDGAGWAAPHAVEIAFATPFPYAGGHLVLDFTGEPVASARSPMWPIDFDSGPASSASIAMVGRPADPRIGGSLILSDFSPGGEAVLMSNGPVGTSCIGMFGVDADPQGLDLAGYAAPGCRLHVTPFGAVSAVYPRNKNLPVTLAEVRVRVPLSLGMLGAGFAVQWLQAPNPNVPAGWITTQAFRVRLTHTVPSCDVATLRSSPARPQSEHGDVNRNLTPVLRFTAK